MSAREVRVVCAMLLCIAPVALAGVLLFGRDAAPDVEIAGLGGDFPTFFVGGRLLNEYPVSRLYDLGLQERFFHDTRPDEKGLRLPYHYPPHVAVFFRPFARLPYAWAFAAWSLISMALYLGGLWALFRTFGPHDHAARGMALLLALAFEPFLVETLAGGQLSTVAFACFAAAVCSEQRGRHFLSGVCVSLCAYKPTLLTLVVPMLVVSGRWGTLLGFAAGIGSTLAFTILTMGGSVLADYLAATTHFGRLYVGSSGVLRVWKFVDVRAFMIMLTGNWMLSMLAAAGAACLALPLLLRAWRARGVMSRRSTAATRAATLAWTLLLSFYVPFYDCTLVVLVFILIVRASGGASQVSRLPVLQWLLLLAFITPWSSQIAALHASQPRTGGRGRPVSSERRPCSPYRALFRRREG